MTVQQQDRARPHTASPTARPLLGVRRQPGRLALAVFRLPLSLYRRGWGWLLGDTFLLLVHAGRKTGQPHAIVAMVLTYDPGTHEAVICSAWGENTDWMRNIRVRPALQVEIGRQSYTPEQRILSEDESFEVVVEFRRRHPWRMRLITRILGWGDLRSETAIRDFVRDRPFVSFRPGKPDTRLAPGCASVSDGSGRETHWTTGERARHWDAAYAGRSVRGLSWYQDEPTVSLELIDGLGLSRDAAVIDVGGGTSSLAAHLIERGFVDVSVLDLSATALAEAQRRLGDGVSVHWLQEDLLVWRPQRRYDLWHDRAVFHFLVNPLDRDAYLQILRAALRPKGCAVIATFASDGPRFCSGLPVLGYAAADLARLLGPEFEQVETRREEHTTPTGVVQPFTWVAGRMRPS